jgi:hypothetical protein
MKQCITFCSFFFLSLFSFAQIGLPVQSSFLPKNNLVVNYDFSKSTSFTRGASTVTNIAGTASGNATLVGSPIFMNSLGYVSFNGSTQYLVTPDLRSYFKPLNASVQKSFTMSLWICPAQLNGVIVSELNSQTPGGGWHASNIEIINGSIYYRIWNGTSIVSSSTVKINQWYHLAMVYDGVKLKAYLNGILQGTQTNDREIPTTYQHYAIAAPEPTQMGSGGGYGVFNLAQYKLYQLPLSDADILQEYELRKSEFDYTVHSPSSNTNPTYWNVSTNWNSETTFNQDHYTPWLNNTRLGWAALYNDSNQWITLNYDEPAYIKGVVIQPRANSGNQFVTKVHVETSLTGAAPWTRVVSDIPVSTNITDDARLLFPTSVFAKSVKVIPVAWTNHITMRMGMLVKPNNATSDNLVLHYNPSMTESYAGTGTNLLDLSGNGLNGTMSNLTYGNSAFTYNGTNAQVNIPDNALLEPGTGSWTIEAWFRPTQFTVNSKTVLGKFGNGGTSSIISYALRQGDGFIRADFSNGTTAFSSDNFTLSLNNWVQLVYVWDKTNNMLYTYSNGVLKQSKAISISGGILNTSTNLYLGSYNGGEYAQYFTGQIGTVRLYKKALNSTEILKNYDANKALYGVIQNGLVMNLSSAPSSGTTWTDVSGNGNNATLVGSPTYTSANGGGYTTSTSSYFSTNYNLPNTFTVSVAASFNPTAYWATLWGNESWTAGKGYIAYLLSSSTLNLGSSTGLASIDVSGINTIHIWDFVVSGTNYTLYMDGVSVSTGTFTAPSGGLSTTGLYFGARHTNAGTSFSDACPGTYYSMRVYNRALNADEIRTNFSFLRSFYGL